jgi:hypothetical protein
MNCLNTVGSGININGYVAPSDTLNKTSYSSANKIWVATITADVDVVIAAGGGKGGLFGGGGGGGGGVKTITGYPITKGTTYTVDVGVTNGYTVPCQFDSTIAYHGGDGASGNGIKCGTGGGGGKDTRAGNDGVIAVIDVGGNGGNGSGGGGLGGAGGSKGSGTTITFTGKGGGSGINGAASLTRDGILGFIRLTLTTSPFTVIQFP